MSNDSSLIFDNPPSYISLDSSSPSSLNRFIYNKDNDDHSRSRSREHDKTSFKYSTMLDYDQNHQFARKGLSASTDENLVENNSDENSTKRQIRRKHRSKKPRIRHRSHNQPLIGINLPNVPFVLEGAKSKQLGLDAEEIEEGEIRRVEVNSDDDSMTETKPSYSEVRILSGSGNANNNNNAQTGTTKDLLITAFDNNQNKSEVIGTMEIEYDHNRPVIDFQPCFLQSLGVPDHEQSKRKMNHSKKLFDSVKQSMEADIDLLFGEDEENDEILEVLNTQPNGVKELEKPKDERKAYFIDNKTIEEPVKFMNIEEAHQVQDSDSELPIDYFSKTSIPLSQNNLLTDPRKKSFKSINPKEKLNLVLDIDETILNSHTFTSDFNVSSIKNISGGHLRTITSSEYKLVIVLRPYALEFLRRVSQYYNIYVYSHGRYEYVKNILAIIDKEEQFIQRGIIFKNFGQVCGSTPKLLSNLGLPPEEVKKTLILDDQRHIWEQDYQRVICSKKFIPLKQFIKEEKYNRYMLFISKQEGNVTGTRWLTHGADASELHHYSESHVIGHKTCQLEGLTHFLEGLAQEYLKKNNTENAPELDGIENLFEAKMKSILKGLKISVITAVDKRRTMFEELGLLLGATIVDPERTHFLLIDDNLEQSQESKVQDLIDRKPLITILSIFWLTECFFCLNRVPIYKFLCQH